MLRINKDVEYALMSLMAMGKDERVVSARELSERFQIPYGLLCKILNKLAHAQIIVSVQGARGGYRLNGTLNDITIGRVMESVHGPLRVAACLDDEGGCIQECNCNIKGIVQRVQNQWALFVHSMTLSQFAAWDRLDGTSDETAARAPA
ncbi:MAG TPA: Rrf2 family transcriptional regulator [Spirochaetia bacterium]|nr:Rrf2 family transcriptional regulator [Spirochaetia bacterium]